MSPFWDRKNIDGVPVPQWHCRLCGLWREDRDPVAAIRAHLAEAHGTVTPTAVSTDVRDSIYRGTRWGR